jgi:dinuclear metal center YbgI/SA1388 family protein
MIKIKDIISELEKFAPLSYQEDYDNAGLIIGNFNNDCKAALLTIDVTENVVDEAIQKGTNLIIAHHPVVFSGLKKITGRNYIERTVIKAIKNDIAIYAAHTNIDGVANGVNRKICDKLKLRNTKILNPAKNQLKKLVTFVPVSHIETVRKAVFEVGAGHIGNYDSCSYNINGKGSFRALEGANPFVGSPGEIHFEEETRFETIFPKNLQKAVIEALLANHPYEEVAYDIYQLDNEYNQLGSGMIGELENACAEKEFLQFVKQIFSVKAIRHTALLGKEIQKVAVCGGSGSFLLRDAIQQKADIFISGDFKYHQFFDAENKIIIADIGHFESEQFTKELFYDILIKKLPNFAFYFSEINTNPIYYF